AAPERDLTDVVDDGAGSARDDADDARIVRNGPLLLFGEQAFGGELLLQLLEGLEKCALPRRLEAVCDHLHLAARRPERRLAPHANARAVLEERAHALRDARSIDHDVE